MNRRELLRSGAAGALGLWTARRIFAQNRLSEKIAVLNAGGANVLALTTDDGLVLVDSGAPNRVSMPPPRLRPSLTRTITWIRRATMKPSQQPARRSSRTNARASGCRPTIGFRRRSVPKGPSQSRLAHRVFETTGSLKVGLEQIDYGYLPLAHTNGDIYVYFRTSNVLAVGDVASPLRDPALDYFTGAWIGGRLDAMDVLFKLANEETKIVPAYGPVMTRTEFKAERDMMDELRTRLFKQVREGEGPQEMLDDGLLKGLPRTWKDPNKFAYDAAKGLWAHHDKIDPNVV